MIKWVLSLSVLFMFILTGDAFSQEKVAPPPMPLFFSESDLYENAVFANKHITRTDSGIIVTKETFESSSVFNARIIVEKTFISKDKLDKFGIKESTPIDSIIQNEELSFYLSVQFKYIEGKPKIENDIFYFNSNDNKVNKKFIIAYANKMKTEIESLKDEETGVIWEKSEAPEPIIMMM